eukprot:gnl/TRDRNA2_/TRDRNA2_185013_c0_seq1.p1 gnl/TRDRNA2_/TRDRNA2_185013_c0~~gnl/TRDRNA2_/TRDRNA2_185013_c0_seq1.p1  ORF type:complete len:550 (+),score=112.66 gnl/TRDRNA2_/TRDRNA2_185013_c0_seq1:134-1783(+)
MSGPLAFHVRALGALMLFVACAVGHRAASVSRLRIVGAPRGEDAIDATLAQLRKALLAGDGPAVLTITDGLRRPFEEAALTNETATVKKTLTNKTAKVVANETVQAFTKDTAKVRANETVSENATATERRADAGECLFDDRIFRLTPEGKKELGAQLEKQDMLDNLKWAREAGWWSCASEGHPCLCMGEVRFVDLDRKQLGKSVDGEGEVSCVGEKFGLDRPAPSEGAAIEAGCECRTEGGTRGPVAKEGEHYSEFHLQRRLSSTSLLQESWIFMLRLLGHAKLLPAGTGDRAYSGIENWGARAGKENYKKFPAVTLERYWINRYIREFVIPYVPKSSTCLEWGDPNTPGSGFNYANAVKQCEAKYDVQFDYTYWQKKPMHMQGNVVYSDILSLPRVLGTLKMDVIFATQVFEHLADPLRSARSLFEATSPGGMVVFTAPMQAQFHKVPHDYLRYTKEGVKYTLVQAGYCVPNWAFAGGGDFIFDIARDAGLQIQDFSLDEMDEAFQQGYDKVSHGAIAVHALGFRPPHDVCKDPTAGWEELKRQGISA